ncbi:MAG: hypothetical protein LUH48_05985 [Clostridiales bacterium]|nr:hypothetical protein [Clostridiales bacterium]
MKKKRHIWLWLLLVVVVAAVLVVFVAGSSLSVSYGTKNTLTVTEEDEDYDAYLEAQTLCSELRANCETYWNGNWPDWYGGMDVVENEGEYLVNVYLTEDTEEHRSEINEAAGQQVRAFTVTNISWNSLVSTLDAIDAVPLLSTEGMGINLATHTVRVYLTHEDLLTMAIINLVDTEGNARIVIIPAKPTISSAVLEEDGTVTVNLSGVDYAAGVVVEISPDSAFEEYVASLTFEGNEATVILSDFGDYPSDDEDYADSSDWYVRAKTWMEVDGVTYEGEWSTAKTVSD